MDINTSNISNPTVCECALAYEAATENFDLEPIDTTPREQKKICKWIYKYYLSREAFGELFADSGKELSDTEFLGFAKQCLDKIYGLQEIEARDFEKNAIRFDEETKKLFKSLLNYDDYGTQFLKDGNNLQLIISSSENCGYILTLKNASVFPDNNLSCLFFKKFTYDEQDGQYHLIVKLENWDDETTTIQEITFSDAETQLVLCRAEASFGAYPPWEYLSSYSTGIFNKYAYGKPLNEKETVLIPLLAEITKITWFATVPEKFDNPDLPLLKKYFKEFNCDKPLKILEKIEQFYYSPKKDSLYKKLAAVLSEKKYEPLWRKLFTLISDSQSEYPQMTDMICNEIKLNHVRESIQQLMHDRGYSGNYPDFIKRGEIRGFHCVSSYEMPYLVGAEKNVVYHIHCNERFLANDLSIEFLCGTEMLKDCEQQGDIYSCMFNANGRRLFTEISLNIENIKQEDFSYDELNDFVNIAVKKAELQKLTKEEKEKATILTAPLLLIVFLGLLAYGLPFGIIMTIGMMLLTVIITLISGDVVLLPDLLSDSIWGQIFFGSMLVYGLVMGVFTLWSCKK